RGRWSLGFLTQARALQSAPAHDQRTCLLPQEAVLMLSTWLSLIVAVSGGTTLSAWAQSAADEVHVSPRVEPAPAAKGNEIVDPALRTHTKPYKVDVDLVLVPVTITDPMNRLVTGLDKDNFTVFEGKDQQ